jgi:hypothetical protein
MFVDEEDNPAMKVPFAEALSDYEDRFVHERIPCC